MMITMLEGRVDEEQVGGLLDSFRSSGDSPPPFVESFLIREVDSDLWRIVTVWESWEAIEGYRASVDTPAGVLMFRSAGVEPSLSVSEVSAHISQG
jgi:hypothetical protein